MFGIELVAFVGTLLTEIRTRCRQLGAVIGIPRHHPGVQRRRVGNITAQFDTAAHLFIAHPDTLSRTPFAGLRRLKTIVNTLRHSLVLADRVDML